MLITYSENIVIAFRLIVSLEGWRGNIEISGCCNQHNMKLASFSCYYFVQQVPLGVIEWVGKEHIDDFVTTILVQRQKDIGERLRNRCSLHYNLILFIENLWLKSNVLWKYCLIGLVILDMLYEILWQYSEQCLSC